MPNFIDITGKKFGKWFVIEYAGRSIWTCRCECGTMLNIDGYLLRTAQTKQCNKCKVLSQRNKHLGKKYGNWTVLKYESIGKYLCRCNKCQNEYSTYIHNIICGYSTQCVNCRNKQFKRNIKHTKFYQIWIYLKKKGNICREWDENFINFHTDTFKTYEKGKFIVAKDRNVDMDKDNYEWSDTFCQKGRTQINIMGIVLSKADWARHYGISRQGFDYRLKNGLIKGTRKEI